MAILLPESPPATRSGRGVIFVVRPGQSCSCYLRRERRRAFAVTVAWMGSSVE
jgi:hypothetical protein